MSSDPIADMLASIRNALAVHQEQVLVPASEVKSAIAKILQEEGYIEGYEVTGDKPQPILKIRLKYTDERRPLLSGLERVSRPGRRVYVKANRMPWVLSGMGIAILSTPKGMMSDRKARHLRMGGELICKVW